MPSRVIHDAVVTRKKTALQLACPTGARCNDRLNPPPARTAEVVAIMRGGSRRIGRRAEWGGPQDRAEIWRARAKSFAVRPPAEWVLRVSVTLFQLMVMSGWWLAVSAR